MRKLHPDEPAFPVPHDQISEPSGYPIPAHSGIPLRLFIALHATQEEVTRRMLRHEIYSPEAARLRFADDMLKAYNEDQYQ